MVSSHINHTHTIILNQQPFQYQIYRKSIHSFRLKLISANLFYLSVPQWATDSRIQSFLKDHQNWILAKSANFPIIPEISSLMKVTILGEIYDNKYLDSNSFAKHYKSQARTLISNELEKLCQLYNFSYNQLRLGNQRSRFGSCSGRNNLNFNWQIIFLPYIIFRHLLLHELVHTKIKNHSPDFWSKLTICDSNTKKNNIWLKKNGARCFYLPTN